YLNFIISDSENKNSLTCERSKILLNILFNDNYFINKNSNINKIMLTDFEYKLINIHELYHFFQNIQEIISTRFSPMDRLHYEGGRNCVELFCRITEPIYEPIRLILI